MEQWCEHNRENIPVMGATKCPWCVIDELKCQHSDMAEMYRKETIKVKALEDENRKLIDRVKELKFLLNLAQEDAKDKSKF